MDLSKIPTSASHTAPPDRTYWEELVSCGYHAHNQPFVAHFSRLSRLNITYLLNELVKIKSDIRQNATTDRQQMERLGQLLHQYSEALRDYQFMSTLHPLSDKIALHQRLELETAFDVLAKPQTQQSNSSRVPVIIENAPYDTHYLTLNPKPTRDRDAIREFLRVHLPKNLSWSEQEKADRRADYGRGLPPEIYSPFINRLARFLVGIVGGAWLIVPLLIMAYHVSLTKTMITVSVATVLFALAVSLVLETDNKDTVTATATYAAVLVVFVGTSTGSP